MNIPNLDVLCAYSNSDTSNGSLQVWLYKA